MRTRALITTAVVAVLLAWMLAWVSRPETHADLDRSNSITRAEASQAMPRGAPPAVPIPRAAPLPRVVEPPAEVASARQVQATAPSIEGVAGAALERRDAIEECLLIEEESGRPFAGRPALQITVYPRDDGAGVEVSLAATQEHRAEAEACLADVFEDAVFERPEVEETVIWPLPWR